MRSNKNKYLIIAASLLLAPGCLFAAEAAPAAPTNGGYNVMFMTLVGLMLILLFFIGMLANTLKLLGEVLGDKFKRERKANSGFVKTLLALVFFSFAAFHSFGADSAAPATAAAPAGLQSVGGMAVGDYYAIMAFIIFELIIIFVLTFYIRILSNTIKGKYEGELAPGAPKKSWFWDDFNAAVPIEKEKDLLLDHNYDGIQELDNSLPPWWKYGFYLTIIVGIIYLYRYHVSHDGQSQVEEYTTEMQKGEADKAAYLAKSANNVDESTVTLLTDAGSIGEGKTLFDQNCVACHLADGGGSVGPNLTDDYWLHKGGIQDIFKSIKYGWQDKGMKSWKDDFSPKQLQELSSYVKSLRGTKPAVPKAPQGDLYIEAGAAAPAGAAENSKTTTTDSTKKAK